MIPNDNTTVKHTVKDSVFTDVFSIPENVLELYRTFHPEDSSVTVEDIQISTLSSIIINRLINDLGFYVKKNGKAKFVILAEEQSYWNPNITYRMFGYLVDTLNNYLHDTKQSVHSTKRVSLPEIELYVIYAGNEDVPDSLSFKDDFFNGNCPVDLQVKIIKKSGTDSIIGQYISFCKVYNDQFKIYGNSIEAAKATIKYCIDHGILKDYLMEHSEEVITMMAEVFDVELQREEYDVASKAEAIKETENKYLLSLIKHVNSGKLKLSDAASIANMTVDEFKKASEALTSH
ncbi:Rpn family recombination-promoting nuclease/putative transposase [Ruminococcus sp. HUN007]|uniref:Rpn family recombination-promoting nuclease/putative transposase n=1 Tax=Ruminococcus sp. HUN007 TaxID=1514668 RepID=UPI0005D1E4B5|nr:Rpn family recombination-promoting nuclease/putative transposase [Ruminococcus sp. HUN007]